jgi:parallel beta-helix repeat protein
MKRELFSGFLVISLLISMLGLAFTTRSGKAEGGTIYVRADGSIDPPTAPISTIDNVTYILTGNVTSDADGIVVERSNIIINGNGCTVEGSGTGSGSGLSLTSVTNVTIQNTDIKNFFDYGISLAHSSQNSVRGNNMTGNRVAGIMLHVSSNNSISGNAFVNDGLFILEDSYGNVVVDNLVNGKPLVYLEGVSGYTVEDAGQVILVNCTNILVENLNLSNTDKGVELWETTNTTVAGNNITHGSGIYVSLSSNNSISGNNIAANGGDGIHLHVSSNNSISGNNVENNGWGIDLYSSTNNSISGNNVTANNPCGIHLHSSSNNSINGNNIANNEYGIHLNSSSNNGISENNVTANYLAGIFLNTYSLNNSIIRNNMIRNRHGILLISSSNNIITGNVFTGDGLVPLQSYEILVENNLVNGKPLVYLEDVSNYVVEDAGQVILINCNNILIENLNLSNTDYAIQLGGTNNTTIRRNHITGNSNYGILFHDSSNNNSILGNNIVNSGYGMWLETFSDNNSIVGNNIANNSHGILLGGGSLYNRIFHNNFINNTQQTASDGFLYLHPNFWDDGYPSGGNYWSDYAGVDSNHDGIGDAVHVIDGNNTDRYPLTGMFSDFNATSEHHIQTICNSTISEFHFNGTAIRFNVTGDDVTVGFCRICIPTALINAPYRVLVNGTEVTYELLACSNITFSYLYFNYTHSTREVIVIPEFLSFLILPLFMTATLLAAIVYRKKSIG